MNARSCYFGRVDAPLGLSGALTPLEMGRPCRKAGHVGRAKPGARMTLRRGISLLAVSWALVQFGSVRSVRASQASSDGDFDDPKLARESQPPSWAPKNGSPPAKAPLKVRPVSSPPSAAAAASATTPSATTPPPASVVSSATTSPPPTSVVSSPAVSPATEAPPAVAPPPQSAVGSPPARADVAAHAGLPTPITKPESTPGAWPYAPRLKLGYRRFPFTRVGAAPTASMPALGPAAPESFESLSLDVYPMSWYLRVGLSSQFGWESGQFDRTGDYFLAQSASVGFQIPGRFTPFVEGLAGAGYMRRRQADDTTLPTAYWQTGIDAGVEIYVAGRAYASLAIGYLHPANLFLMQKSLMSVNLDTWSLKLGFGI